MRMARSRAAVFVSVVASLLIAAGSTLLPVAASAQTCPYNSTQASCACPTSGGGTTCFGGLLYRASDASCQSDSRPCTSSTQVYDCSSLSCVCPSGTTQCSSSGSCVTNRTCPTGSTWNVCADTCDNPYVLISPSSAQTGYISVTGDLKSSGGDAYLSSGKAIRVDGSGVTTLNVGNWGSGGTSMYMGLYGSLGIGTSTPTGSLNIVGTVDPVAANVDSYGSAVASNFTGRRARGTTAAPTAAQSGDALAFFSGRAYGTTGFSSLSNGAFIIRAAENQTDAAHGTLLTLETTPNGSTTRAERVRIDQNGYVGIGTSTPGTLLDVNGTAKMTGLQLTTGAGAGKVLVSDASGNGTWTTQSGITGSGTTNYHAKFTSASAIGNSLVFDDGTNVGIGNAAPTALLSVGPTSQFKVTSAGDTSTSGKLTVAGHSAFGATASTSTNYVTNISENLTGNIGLGMSNIIKPVPSASPASWFDAIYADVDTSSAGATNFTSWLSGIEANVVVGHSGTTQSAYAVNGEVYRSGSGAVTDMAGVYGAASNGGSGTITNLYGMYSNLYFGNPANVTNAYGLRVYQSGTPSGTLTNNYGIYIDSIGVGTNKYALYSAGGQSYLSGNLGLGVAVPTQKLDVNGTAKMTGFLMATGAGAGKVLTSDASGNGTWTTAASAPVTSVSGSGSGISVAPTTGAVVVSNTGVTSATAGTGIGVSGATGAVTFSNTGVTSLTAGSGISLSGSTGAVTITDTNVAGVTGSGTANYVPKFTAASSIGNSQIVDNGTTVGIGGSASGQKLMVLGDAYVQSNLGAGVSPSSNMGVRGYGSAYGVYGEGPSYGVSGTSTGGAGIGVYGTGPNWGGWFAGGTQGVYGSGSTTGGSFSSSGTYGVYGNGGTYGVYGNGTFGVYGTGIGTGMYGSGNTYGVWGQGGNYGLYGNGSYGVAGVGSTTGVAGNGGSYGVNGTGGTYGVYGSGSNYGLFGTSSWIGVQGTVNAGGGIGVSGTGQTYGVQGSGFYGVIGSGTSTGVYGQGSGGTYGVYGNGGSYGVYGTGTYAGVYGSGPYSFLGSGTLNNSGNASISGSLSAGATSVSTLSSSSWMSASGNIYAYGGITSWGATVYYDLVASGNSDGAGYGWVYCAPGNSCACPNGYFVTQVWSGGQYVYCNQL